MTARSPRMTLPTQLVLRALLEDPGVERYGLEIGDIAGLPSGTIHPSPGPPGTARVGGVAVGGRRPRQGRTPRPPLLPTHDGRYRWPATAWPAPTALEPVA